MFLFIDNYDSFSWNLVQAFYALGRKPVVHANDDPRILELATSPELEAVCISPGPSHPRNAGLCLEFLKRLPASVPVLGVCLGHQSIGAAFGGKIVRAQELMHGKTSTITTTQQGVFAGLPRQFTVNRYHSLAIERSTCPEDLVVTAWTDDGEIMGVRHKTLDIEGVQFHPESILTEHGHAMLKNFLEPRA